MKKYTFLVFHKEYDQFLQLLRAAGVVHISEKAEGTAQDDTMQALLVREKELRHIIDQQAPDQLLSDRADILKRLLDTEKRLADLTIWGEFSSRKVAELAKAGYQLRFFVCQKAKFQEEWGTVVAEKSGNLYFASVLGLQPVEDIVAAGISEVLLDQSPADIRAEIDGLKGLLAAADARIEAWKLQELPKVETELAEVIKKADWQRVVLSTDHAAENALCLLEGYCPEEKALQLNQKLDAQHIYYQAVDPVLGDNAPAQLKNNKFAQMFEVFTGMYGWPTYGEFDPTPVLAPFYLLFFAMCMGDCGYGLILMLFGYLLAKGKVNIEMFKGLGPIITVLGAGTTVVGMILGTFFGLPLYEQTWYPDALKAIIIHGKVMSYDAQMVLAIGIGIFHLCVAMMIKAICYTKRFGFKETISVWSWNLLIIGSILVLGISSLLHLDGALTTNILIALGAVSALGIYVFNKPGRNPLINIGAGLYDTYNMATGILGDVLSYVRLYALGLAGGMLGNAFNDLGLMLLGESPTWQYLPFVLILLLGHTLNILMSGLGAFVHPLRLTFVEYFKNAGYEGKGELYKPFAD